MRDGYILGIELGSTRIKSVLIDRRATVLVQGTYEWASTLTEDGYYSYALEEVERGLQASFAELSRAYRERFGEELRTVAAIGVSAMMHGYLAFDASDRLLTPFRTWQNTNTARAAEELTELFDVHIPERWSVAHFYQAVLDREAHVPHVAHLTTLSGYVHYRLTGCRVLGIGDASGMFPIAGDGYDRELLARFDRRLAEAGLSVSMEDLLPTPLFAGASAGVLTEQGARLLAPDGRLSAGCPVCPPEGDAGTGMVATNSILPRTANVSAGTSAFLMAVLERPLRARYREIDVVTTPCGAPVAMVHVNNFTSEMNAWVHLFEEVLSLADASMERGALFDALYKRSLAADSDLGGLVGFNFAVGEPTVGVGRGVPLIARAGDGRLSLANLMKMHIYSALGALAIGMQTLEREGVRLDAVYGHGGFFKTPEVGQRAMSAAVGAPVTVCEGSGEGGAFGIALLALYALRGEGTLAAFLEDIFRDVRKTTVEARPEDKDSFASFMNTYRAFLSVERLSEEVMKCRKN